MKDWSWSQPACDACWYDRNHANTPVRLHDGRIEVCVFCGTKTRAGIYIRIDPKEARYPSVPAGS